MAVFFQANAYFQIKTNNEMTSPDSAEFRELEKLETDGYERAKNLRQEILQDVSQVRTYDDSCMHVQRQTERADRSG